MSKKYYRLFYESHDLIQNVSLNGDILDVNPSWCKTMGYTLDEALKLNIKDIIHSTTNCSDFVEIEFKTKNGELITVRGNSFDNLNKNGSSHDIWCVYKNVTAQKNLEKELRANEKMFKDLFYKAGDLIVYLDKGGKIININQRSKDVFGYEPEELIGKNFASLELLKPDDLSKLVKVFYDNINKSESPDFLELEVIHKDGYFVHVESSSKLIKKDDEVKGVLAIIRNISERKKLENELKNSEEMFKSIVQNAKTGIILSDTKGNIIEYNSTAQEIYGMPSSDVLKMTVWDFIKKTNPNTPISKEMFKKSFNLAINTGKIHKTSFETNIKLPDGLIKYINFNLSTIKKDDKHLILQISNDITERKKLEDELIERIKELKCLYKTSKIIDKKDLSINEALEEIVELLPPGWNFPELACARITVNDVEYKTDNFKETIWNQSSDVIIDEEVIGKIQINYLKDKPFLKEEVDLINNLGINIGEFIERRNLEEKLKEISKRQSRAITFAAHEIKSPLTALKGFLELINLSNDYEKTIHDLGGKKLFHELYEKANRINEFADNQLDVKRIEQGEFKVIKKKDNLWGIIKETYEGMKFQLNEKNIDLELNNYSTIDELLIDSERMKQVFNNIISNAIKYSPEETKIILNLNEGENYLEVQIIDEGEGFSKNELKAINNPKITPFKRQKRKMFKQEGMGIGLFITKTIIKEHDGKLRFDSEGENKGSIVTLKLPF